MDDSKGETAPALGISINAQVAPTRQVTLQSFIDRDATGADIDKLMDKLHTSLDRTSAFYEMEEEAKRIEVDENVLANVTKRLGEVEDNMSLKAAAEGRRTGKLSEREQAQEAVQKKQARDSYEEAKRRVDAGKARLAELKKKAGNRDGVNSSPNR